MINIHNIDDRFNLRVRRANIDLSALFGAMYSGKHPLTSYANEDFDPLAEQAAKDNAAIGLTDPSEITNPSSNTPYQQPGFWAKVLTPGIASQIGEANFNYQQRPLLAQQAEQIKTQQAISDVAKGLAASKHLQESGGVSGLTPEERVALGDSGTLDSQNHLTGEGIKTVRGYYPTIANTEVANAQIARELADTKNAGHYGLLAGENALGSIKLGNHANDIATKLQPNTDWNLAAQIDATTNMYDQFNKNRHFLNNTQDNEAFIHDQLTGNRRTNLPVEILGDTAQTYGHLLDAEHPSLGNRVISIDPSTGTAIVAPPKLTPEEQAKQTLANFKAQSIDPHFVPKVQGPSRISILGSSPLDQAASNRTPIEGFDGATFDRNGKIHIAGIGEVTGNPTYSHVYDAAILQRAKEMEESKAAGNEVSVAAHDAEIKSRDAKIAALKAEQAALQHAKAKQSPSLANSGLLGVIGNRLSERINSPSEMGSRILGNGSHIPTTTIGDVGQIETPIDPYLQEYIPTALNALLFGDPNQR